VSSWRKLTSFFRYIAHNQLLIGSIVVDEIHTVLTSSDFRKQLKNVKSLMTTGVPITFLSATIPIRLEEILKQQLGIPKEHRFIRANTSRPEHQYLLFQADPGSLVNQTAAFVTLSTKRFLQDERRGILFVRSMAVGDDLKEIFPSMDFIQSRMTDSGVRLEAMKKWEGGRSDGWIIGTTSLIQGVDYHDVHLVVFVGVPFSMIDFVQGAGRAGRNGKPSKVVVINDGKTNLQETDDDLSCMAEMKQWTSTLRCRRLGISECMDEDHHSCASLENANLCDICQPDDDMKMLWKDTKGSSSGVETMDLQSNLISATSGSSSLNEQENYDPLPLKPRLARKEVILHSGKELNLQEAREKTASKCVDLLEDFSPNCGICLAEGGKMTGKRHKTISECSGTYGQHFRIFYDWNKPRKVRGC
jgi:superfamily II DNA helicase RecQ